jgi:multiple sugar transport system substrate-binding protein
MRLLSRLIGGKESSSLSGFRQENRLVLGVYMKQIRRVTLALIIASSLGLTLAQNTTLQWWDYYNDTAQEGVEALIAAYEEAHPDVTIERTYIGFGDLKARIIQAAATSTMPDILIVDNPDHQAMASQGALADLSSYIADWAPKDQYFGGAWSSTVYEDKNYGVPYDSNATALYYNQDLLDEAGVSVPTTWDELRDAAAALTSGDRSGFCLSLIATEEGTFTYLPFLWGNGGDIPEISSESNIEALTLLNAMMNEDGSISKAALNWSQGDANNQFLAGKCAMMINGPWQLPSLTEAGINFGVSTWPNNGTPTSILGGENFAIGAGSNIEAAWATIEWMTQPENLLEAHLISNHFPNREDIAADPAFNDDPIKKTFTEQIAVAKARAYGPNYPQISEQIMAMVQSVLIGARTPEQAATDTATAITPLLP